MSWLGWYWAEVKGNLLATAPCAVAVWLWLRAKHGAIQQAHRELKAAHAHAAHKLDQLLDALDPNTTGGIAEIRDLLDPSTPGGVHGVVERLDELETQLIHDGHSAEPPREPPAAG